MNAETDTHVRERLLAAALALMLQKGYAATSINEICQAAGVTKGAFFHYFANKEALGEAVLDYYWQPLWVMFQDTAPYLQLEDPLARIRAHVGFVADMHDVEGVMPSSLFGNFAQELSIANPALSNLAAEAFDWWTDLIQADLDEAARLYEPVAAIDTRSVAEQFVVVYEGSLILAKAKQDTSVIRQHLAQYTRYIDLLFRQG